MQSKLTLSDIRALREDWAQFVLQDVKGEFVKPVPMVNSGYLHALNASFDGLFLREQQVNSLLQARHAMKFGTIQPCARMEDKLTTRSSLLHLGLFEIYGYSILGFEAISPAEMAKCTILDFYNYYVTVLGCAIQSLRVYYFSGGTLRQVTNGKVDSDEYIPADDFSVRIWKSLGLTDSQLIPDQSQETFLLHTGNPLREHHSGYRNDIFTESSSGPFEIATLNFISHHTVIDAGAIVGIAPLPFYLREMALGQERCLAALADINNLYNLPHVCPLVNAISEYVATTPEAMMIADMLRVLHYTIADGWTASSLHGKRFKEHRHEINQAMRIVTEYSEALTNSRLLDLLFLNADLQPWYPLLKQAVGRAAEEIRKFSPTREDLQHQAMMPG